MEIVDQHTKDIMEGCKRRALDAGLSFEDETLEYIVTNRDLIELTPKVMIPTLYDYWVHDVEILRETGRYELYPSNPYETVINTRPAISFYNDNNPDWMNVMIFYHVLAHIDFFQNNLYYQHTWDYDFTGQALSDKRLIAKLRSEKGRWVDYVIEFARGIDNLVGYHRELARLDEPETRTVNDRVDYYFDVFLQTVRKLKISEYIKEIERYNECMKGSPETGEKEFFSEVTKRNPEFEAVFKKYQMKRPGRKIDLMQYISKNSAFLNKEENQWMKSVMEVIRKTSIFFQPQIRTKIMNEGWASYWHEKLFLKDDRIKGHEVDFAKTHAGVASLPRVGLNPYALGMRLFYYIEELGNKGKYSIEFRHLLNAEKRKKYDKNEGKGRDFIFKIRKNFSDFLFINTFIDDDFVEQYNLFVADKRLNKSRMVWEYYVKSRDANDYKKMLLNTLYHPPFIEIHPDKTRNGNLYLVHRFEGKPLVKEYIANTMMGIEYLWGNTVQLETSEVAAAPRSQAVVYASGGPPKTKEEGKQPELKWERVLYTMKNRKLSRIVIRKL